MRRASILAHLMIVAYVAVGWTVNWRTFLFVYLLVLPSIIIQWLLNFGSSVVSNFENLARNGHWDDDVNALQGVFLQTLLREIGLVLSNGTINTIACILMFVFWVQALWRMILITPVLP